MAKQGDLDASIAKLRGSDDVAAVMGLVKRHEMVELELLGGKGPDTAGVVARPRFSDEPRLPGANP